MNEDSIRFRVAKSKVTLVGQGASAFPIRAQILLRGDDDEKAKVNFYRPGQAFPDDQMREGVLYISLPEDQLAAVLLVLRADEPVYVGYHNGHGVVSTIGEEVGV
ncbi:MAG: hypothetical protein RIM84_13965 [Alphaproteobacteria bacterium]